MREMVVAFLDEQSTCRFNPGTYDCALDLADFFLLLGLPDPAADVRGTYYDEAGSQGIIEAHGGLVQIIDHRAALAAGVRLVVPQAGAIGVVGSRHDLHRQWCAIHDGDFWFSRVGQNSSLSPIFAPALTMWAVGFDRFPNTPEE